MLQTLRERNVLLATPQLGAALNAAATVAQK
jgi:hypothetical protein